MKNEILVSFNYGYHRISFKKIFDLPFTPFYGLTLMVSDINEIELTNNDCRKTTIDYNFKEQQFEIYVRIFWKKPVSDETIDYTMESFQDWERQDNTNIAELKNLMERMYKEKHLPNPQSK